MKKPNFFIIGAPKCGTTSLYFWLSEHPKIYMSPIKEPHFFSKDLNLGTISNLEEYEKLFARASADHLAVGEASTTYLFSKEAVANIEKTYPNSKYIVMIRNPVEMAYSLHEELVWSGNEHIRDFETAWRLRCKPYHQHVKASRWCREPKLLNYLSVCSLGSQLERLLNIIPYNRVLILLLEDVKDNPRREYMKVLEFLNVPDDGRTNFPVHNVAKEAKWPFFQKVLRVIGSEWITAKKLFGIKFRTGIQVKLMRMNTRYRARPPLKPEFRKELQVAFLEEIQKMEKLLGRSLSHWLT